MSKEKKEVYSGECLTGDECSHLIANADIDNADIEATEPNRVSLSFLTGKIKSLTKSLKVLENYRDKMAVYRDKYKVRK